MILKTDFLNIQIDPNKFQRIEFREDYAMAISFRFPSTCTKGVQLRLNFRNWERRFERIVDIRINPAGIERSGASTRLKCNGMAW